MEISAVICTRERYAFLSRAIASLTLQVGVDGIFEIIVVDNSPDAAKAADFARDYADVGHMRFIHISTPGLSNARNVAAATATGRIVAYLDDDAVASVAWASSLLETFDQFGPEAGIVGGPVAPLWEAHPPFVLTKTFKDIFSLIDLGGVSRVMSEGEWLAGCNIAFDRAALLEAGGFDLNLGRTGNAAALLSNEELLACDRIKKLGKTMVYASGAVVDHFIPADRANWDWIVRRIAWQTVSDAMSHPERARKHARYLATSRAFPRRLKRAMAWLGFWRRRGRRLKDSDYFLIYDMINELLCTGL
jgi:glycosyltransferase involved in cell wall biosynthesis